MLIRFIFCCLISGVLFQPNVYAAQYGKRFCQMPGFTCIHVRRSQSWKSLWPNDQDRDLVMRINRLNISLYPGLLIAVPNHLAGQDAIDFAPFPKSITPPKEKVIIVDPNVLAFGAYNAAGRLVYWGPISAGSNY